ncbi:MAG: hypothetical protein ACE5I3_15650 [Phycisphaerae bacterium]
MPEEKVSAGGPRGVGRRVARDVEEPLPDYSAGPEAGGAAIENEPEVPVAAARERNTIVRRPATTAERERILSDPLVQQAIELFDGAVVNMEREVGPTPTESPEEAELTE